MLAGVSEQRTGAGRDEDGPCGVRHRHTGREGVAGCSVFTQFIFSIIVYTVSYVESAIAVHGSRAVVVRLAHCVRRYGNAKMVNIQYMLSRYIQYCTTLEHT